MGLYPPVIIVDNKDNVIGESPLNEVWRKGLYHRIVRVVVIDKHNRFLLQRRASDMELYPGCWDVSAAGHVDVGKTYDFAARQELVEELGLAEGDLTEVAYYQSHNTYRGRTLNRFNKLFTLRWNYTPELYSREEVSEVRWFTQDQIIELVTSQSSSVSDGLRETMPLLLDEKDKIPDFSLESVQASA